MENRLTLGSLFDGSGGFPLGGLISGIIPVWASEIEPFPIRVTTKRLPFMKHYGDVTAMDGSDIEPVDIITFGSPCQDMSIAGKREGLEGNRSGLFYEAIRIIKEMRCATNGKYPRYIVWENVPGAFSSNKGEDFRCLCESICRIADETVSVPKPDKWQNAGSIVGGHYSLAWRVLDAQYWGVPQRRKRIYLVADFDGGSAGKILFESEGLSGYSAQGLQSWQSAAGSLTEGPGATGIGFDRYNGDLTYGVAQSLTASAGCSGNNQPMVFQPAMVLNDQGGQRMDVTEDVTNTLRAQANHPPLVFENHSQDSRYTGPLDVAQTVLSTFGTGGNNQPFVVEDAKTYDVRFTSEGTKNARQNCYETDTARTIDTGGNSPDSNQGGVAVVQAYGICSKDSNAMKSDNPRSGFYEADTSRTLDGNGGNPSCNQGGIAVVSVQGSMIGRKDENGPLGSGIGDDVSFTLNTVDRHAVAFADAHAALSANDGPKGPSSQMLSNPEENFVAEPADVAHPVYTTSKNSYHTEAEEDVANTLVATDYKDPPTVTEEPYYIVRRLTPTECARLQGFPDWWCAGLGTEKVSDEELYQWYKVFETWRMATNPKGKPKTSAQIRKWLSDPYSDSAEYKMWGNGVALPCVVFVLSGIVYYAQFPPKETGSISTEECAKTP